MARVESKRSFGEVEHLPSYTPLLPPLAEVLTSLCLAGDSRRHRAAVSGFRCRSPFEGSEPETMSVKDFLVRLCKYGHCSPATFAVAVLYIHRYMCQMCTGTVLSSWNVHRLFLTAFVVAAKVRDDVYYQNPYYATIGGISPRSMNTMEAAFLTVLNWKLHVEPREYDSCVAKLGLPALCLQQPYAAGDDAPDSDMGNCAGEHGETQRAPTTPPHAPRAATGAEVRIMEGCPSGEPRPPMVPRPRQGCGRNSRCSAVSSSMSGSLSSLSSTSRRTTPTPRRDWQRRDSDPEEYPAAGNGPDGHALPVGEDA